MKFILELVRSIGERLGGIAERVFIFSFSFKETLFSINKIYMVTRKWYMCFDFLDKEVLQIRTSKISPISYQILIYILF